MHQLSLSPQLSSFLPTIGPRPLLPISVFSARRLCRQSWIFMQSSTPGSPGEEPPETLFMRELKRRGLSKRSEDEDRSVSGTETKIGTEDRSPGPQMTPDQRKQSMALNSEGLEGLIPRARALLSLGGGFFLVFWPLIITSFAAFVALYYYYGPTFIHSGEGSTYSQHSFVDPYELLENDKLPSKNGPAYVPFSKQ